jgi:hypothetical protein
MGRVTTMIWRDQNNGPQEPGELLEDSRSDFAEPGNSGGAMSSTGERVETDLAAAELTAAEIRRDAEQWAQRHMEEARRRADERTAQRVQELSSTINEVRTRAQAIANRPVSDGARLVATQMAVAGGSRERIGSRLREEFGIEDPSAILDEAGL